MSNFPDFHLSKHKNNARLENIKLYRKYSGLKSIPKNRQYWTLCNLQKNVSGSEINQLVENKLISEQQFCGVDRDVGIITINRTEHPKANWYCGEWLDVIETDKCFKPAMIYLDTANFADRKIGCNFVINTMLLCPSKTLLLANLMANDVRSKKQFDLDYLLRKIEQTIPAQELVKWKNPVDRYFYSTTGKCFMVTFAFWKK